MARNVEDAFGKNILHDLFRLRGLAETEADVPPGNGKRIDVWFVPENDVRTVGAPVFTGVLEEMASDSAAIELWSDPPSGDDFHTSLGKREVWHDVLELRDKRSWPRPPLWHVCAGKPVNVIKGFGLEPATIPGLYRPPAPDWRVHVVVVGELPTTRDTILLRLLGRGRVRQGALRELRALPDDAWEKPLAQAWLMRLGFEVPWNVAVVPEEKEFFMDVQVWYKEFCEERERAGREQAMREIEPKMAERERVTREQLVRELETRLADERRQAAARLADEQRQAEVRLAETQLQVEVKPIVHIFERRLGRPITSSERNVLAVLIKTEGSDRITDLVLDLSAPDLAAWLKQGEAVPTG